MSEISMGIHTMPYTTTEQVLRLREAAILCQREAIDQGVKAMQLEQQLSVERQKREALEAHVERLTQIGNSVDMCAFGITRESELWVEACEDAPKTSLAQRDARVSAKAASLALAKLYDDSKGSITISRGTLLDLAMEYKRKADEIAAGGSHE